MNNPGNISRNSAAAVQLCFLLARRARSYFITSTNTIQKDGGNICLENSTSEVDEVQEQSFIDYSVLPLTKERTEKDAASHRQDISRKQIRENGITKKKISLFLEKFMSYQESFQHDLQNAGMCESHIHEATNSFTTHLMDGIAEDENLAYFIKKIAPDADDKETMFECFLTYAKQRYPLHESAEELRTIGDLTNIASWFTSARKMKRKIVFHSGPTNSGKTYHALKRFQDSNSGIYGGPLRMLAAEVYSRTNMNGIKCDMITGEQRLYSNSEFDPSDHVACTVEMYNLSKDYECAVIDEIQLLRDVERGWGWTNAFLGVQANEVHVCGEPAAEHVLKALIKSTGDDLEIRRYKRLTPLHIQRKSLGHLQAVRSGDCVVAFSRQKIFQIKAEIEKTTRHKCSIIYGGLPPQIRLEQARRFNDPNCEQTILIASDAIGMGLNLSIRRLIFHSLRKFDGRQMIRLPAYHAKQIAGRAGRFGTQFPEGYVTTLHPGDLLPLRGLLKSDADAVEKAGLRPSYELIEMISHVLPKATLMQLLDAFTTYAKLDGNYFLCDVEHTKEMAQAISDIPLTLQQQYHLSSAATDRTNKSALITLAVIKIATLFSEGKPIGPDEMKSILDWPLKKSRTSDDLAKLESIHDVFDLHLWMSYKYEAIFVEREAVRELQMHVEKLIEEGIDRLSSKRRKKYWKFARNPFR